MYSVYMYILQIVYIYIYIILYIYILYCLCSIYIYIYKKRVVKLHPQVSPRSLDLARDVLQLFFIDASSYCGPT